VVLHHPQLTALHALQLVKLPALQAGTLQLVMLPACVVDAHEMKPVVL